VSAIRKACCLGKHRLTTTAGSVFRIPSGVCVKRISRKEEAADGEGDGG